MRVIVYVVARHSCELHERVKAGAKVSGAGLVCKCRTTHVQVWVVE